MMTIASLEYMNAPGDSGGDREGEGGGGGDGGGGQGEGDGEGSGAGDATHVLFAACASANRQCILRRKPGARAAATPARTASRVQL